MGDVKKTYTKTHDFFCEVYFLGQNVPCGKSVFGTYHIKKEGFIRSVLSLTLGGADRVEKAKTDMLAGVIYKYLECPLCMCWGGGGGSPWHPASPPYPSAACTSAIILTTGTFKLRIIMFYNALHN